DGDGTPEIAYGSTLFTTSGGALKLKFAGTATETQIAMSTFADVDGKPGLELVTGRAAYAFDGTALWTRADLGNGFPALADMDGDGSPDLVVTHGGVVEILNAATGVTKFGPSPLPGIGSGGPPTIADFTGDKVPEIGVAMQTFYSVLKPNLTTKTLDVIWKAQSHDLSSSVTGSSVFDFEGDGRAEVVYNDECYLWVYDGVTGNVRFAGLTSSFTGTEASIVADVDGDGHAEMVMIANGVDPGAKGWKCDIAPWNAPDPTTGRPAWAPPTGAKFYRGLTVLSDSANSWVGTRTIWSEHTYHVSNICDDRDSACVAPNVYGSIPKSEQANWSLSWLNDFRQNIQDHGIFDAADAVVSLAVQCTEPPTLTVALRNIGLAGLPANVHVGLYLEGTAGETKLGEVISKGALLPGQTEVMVFDVTAGAASGSDAFDARVLNDPSKPTFVECRTDNDDSGQQHGSCVH
ncbi:MAG: FG-GAP repeat domain-containing protein, partial [Polyangiales bacterium]